MVTDEIRWLVANGSPGTSQVKFVLTGDPGNPDGGVFERFNGLTIPGLGVGFNGATPPNSPYQTAIYTNQYDGVADFPRYPLNLIADANAVAGFLTARTTMWTIRARRWPRSNCRHRPATPGTRPTPWS